MIEGLIIANQIRGNDSTGIAAINYNGEFDILKSAIEPWKYINNPKAQSLLRSKAQAFIGHTRLSSMGHDYTDENAHPFVEGNVVGAHNGVINNYLQLDKTVRVDSQAVLRELDMHPDAYDYVFSRVSGSCALTWWDMRDPEALFIVAHANPLAAAIVPKIKTIYWSSLSEQLESVLHTAYGNAVEFVEIKPNTIYRLSADDIYAWSEAKVNFMTTAYQYGYPGTWSQHGDGGVTVSKSPKEISDMIDGEDDEDRYEQYWNRMMEDAAAKEGEESTKPIHSMTDSEYQRFGIDDLDGTLLCGYCDKALGDNGAWDSGLEMLLCRPCQSWWDNYGHIKVVNQAKKASEEKFPLVTL